jgi:hypothetical protein
MRVTSRHRTALERMTTEAVHIVNLSQGPEDEDLNGKSEWGQARVPKLGVTMPNDRRPAQPEDVAADHINTNPMYARYLEIVNGAGGGGGRGKTRMRIPWNISEENTDVKDGSNSQHLQRQQ